MILRRCCGVILVACFVLVATAQATPPSDRYVKARQRIDGEYIVVLDWSTPSDQVPGLAHALASMHQGTVRRTMTHAAKAFSVTGMPEAQARALSRNPHVLVVEENGYMELSSSRATDEWHLDRIDTEGTDGYYTYCETGQGVYVYVVDTGVAKHHDEFWTGSSWKVAPGVSFANDWHPDPDNQELGDVGTNPCGGFTGSESTPLQRIRTYNGGHGTAVASLVAGNTYGVAPDATIVPVKVGSCPPPDADPPTNIVIETEHVCWGLDWIVGEDNPYFGLGRAVVNISFWIPADDDLVEAVEYVITGVVQGGSCQPYCLPSQTIPVVVSANNQNSTACDRSPSRMAWGNSSYSTHVISVGGTRESDIRWDCANTSGDSCLSTAAGSNHGQCVDIYAPAHDINSASLKAHDAVREVYELRSGTSFAAPIVAGIIAQMLEYNPSLSATGIWNLLSNWSDTLSNSTDPQSIGSIKFVRARPCNP